MPKYFDLEISLLEIEPRIWRRFLIRSGATFSHFHSAIQQAFGWQNCHLYEFLDGDVEEDDTMRTLPGCLRNGRLSRRNR